MNNDFDKKTFISEFNEAAYQIARLNYLWGLCNNFARSGNLISYKWVLDRIWIELSADAKEKNEDYYFKGIELLNKMIAKTKAKDSLYNVLQQKDIFLRSLQESVGKGGKKQRQYGRFM